MFKALLLIVVLMGCWLGLSGHYTPLFIGFGVASVAIAFVMTERLPANKQPFKLSYIFRFPFYFLWLFKEILVSAFRVTFITLNPKSKISPRIAWVPSSQQDEYGQSIFANSITLTPGTVSILVQDKQIEVHALEKENLDDLWQGKMDRMVKQLHG